MTPSVRAACAVVDPARKPYVEDPSILYFGEGTGQIHRLAVFPGVLKGTFIAGGCPC